MGHRTFHDHAPWYTLPSATRPSRLSIRCPATGGEGQPIHYGRLKPTRVLRTLTRAVQGFDPPPPTQMAARWASPHGRAGPDWSPYCAACIQLLRGSVMLAPFFCLPLGTLASRSLRAACFVLGPLRPRKSPAALVREGRSGREGMVATSLAQAMAPVQPGPRWSTSPPEWTSRRSGGVINATRVADSGRA